MEMLLVLLYLLVGIGFVFLVTMIDKETPEYWLALLSIACWPILMIVAGVIAICLWIGGLFAGGISEANRRLSEAMDNEEENE